MEKIKRFWNNNRVLCVLCIIVIICIAITCTVVVKYFFGVNASNYGDRLDDIANLPFKEEDQVSLKNAIEESAFAQKADIRTSGKIIYIRIEVVPTCTLDEAKSTATESIEKIAKEYQEKYDLEYTLVQEGGFTIMGAKNINRDKIVWNNNTPVKKEE